MSVARQESIVGAVEAGGTKFVCAIGSGPGAQLLDRAQFPTGDDPAGVLRNVTAWLQERQAEHGALTALGVASFGPLDLDESSPTYGFITSTPKAGWANTDIVGPLRAAFPGIPIGFDTDVNGAGLGEWRWGAAQGLDDFVYITVGTGLGGGGMARGKLLHGLVHPEMGHMGITRIAGDDFEGVCPFHGRCWEGLCSGPAIEKRAGRPAPDLPPDHPAWDLTIQYMAYGLVNLTCVLSPRRIILGGSVRKAGRLGEARFFERVRAAFRSIMAGYIVSPALTEAGLAEFIVPPRLGDNAGVCGAIALAQAARKNGPARRDGNKSKNTRKTR
ncbi:MAG: ROK family protein [Kiritimatiellaeota bacterium]|nr:ROK family protein [Kiritimatiellota bacterium]